MSKMASTVHAMCLDLYMNIALVIAGAHVYCLPEVGFRLLSHGFVNKSNMVYTLSS